MYDAFSLVEPPLIVAVQLPEIIDPATGAFGNGQLVELIPVPLPANTRVLL